MTGFFEEAVGTTLFGPTVEELHRAVPKEFKRINNPWRMIASKLRQRSRGGVNMRSWKFKSRDRSERDHQMFCLTTLFQLYWSRPPAPTITIQCDEIAAYMLSEMLTEVPQYVPA